MKSRAAADTGRRISEAPWFGFGRSVVEPKPRVRHGTAHTQQARPQLEICTVSRIRLAKPKLQSNSYKLRPNAGKQ